MGKQVRFTASLIVLTALMVVLTGCNRVIIEKESMSDFEFDGDPAGISVTHQGYEIADGKLSYRGKLTNNSSQRWADVKVYCVVHRSKDDALVRVSEYVSIGTLNADRDFAHFEITVTAPPPGRYYIMMAIQGHQR